MPACRVLLLVLALAQLSVVVAVRDSEWKAVKEAAKEASFLNQSLGHWARRVKERWQAMLGEPVKAEEMPSYTLQEEMAGRKEATREEKAEKRDGFLITCMIFGAIIFDMVLLYLLNSSDPQVRSYSYKMLSTGVIVFCALTVENLQYNCLQLVIGTITFSKPHVPGSSANVVEIGLSLVIYSLVFLGWFFFISIVSRRFETKPEDQYCSLNLVAHVCAFTALELIGTVEENWANTLVDGAVGTYSHTVFWLYVLVPSVIWLILRICVEVSGRLRQGMEAGAGPGPEHGHGHVEHHGHEHKHDAEHHDWKLEAIHGESDALAIVVGFLIKQLIVYVITAHPAPMDCGKYPIKCKVGSVKILEMLAPALALSLVVIPVSVWRARHHDHTTWILRLELLLSMTLSWVILQASEWAVLEMVWDLSAADSPLHAKTVKKLICASALSPILIFVILFVDAMADRGFINGELAEVTVQCLAFWIGFYWEKVFSSAIKNVTKTMTYKYDSQAIIPETVLTLGILLVVMPAWRWFVVPSAVKPVPAREGNQNSTVETVVRFMSQQEASSQGAALQEPAATHPALPDGKAAREETARREAI